MIGTKTTNYHYLRTLAMLLALGTALATVLTLAGTAREAEAAFPGQNGKIIFEANRDGNADIYSMNPDGSRLTNLTKTPGSDYEAAVSADAKKIAFTSTRSGNEEVHVMNRDGSSQRRLTKNAAVDSDPAYSPNGKKIAFWSDRNGNDEEIYAMNALDGSRQKNLTNTGALDVLPDWGVAAS